MADNKNQDAPGANEAGRDRGRVGEAGRGATTARQAGEAGAEATTRMAQAGGTAMRDLGEAGAEMTRRSGQSAGHVARQAARGVAEDSRRLSDEMAHDMEESAERYAETLREMAQDLSRLMMLPRSAGGGLQDMQEAMGNVLNGVMRTNIRMTQEMLRRASPNGFVELQGAFVREYVGALMEGGTTLLRATRRTAEEALRPLEQRRRAEGRQHQHAPCVAEVMSREVRVVNPDETVQQAARLMTEAEAGALPVGENDRLVGMVTDRDLAIRVLAEGKDPARTKVREVMSPGTHYVFEDEDLDEVAENMTREQVRRLPVLNRQKRLVGIVSIGDVARRAGERAGRAMAGVARQGGRQAQSAGMGAG
ncbi:CBS domain-containing protein [Falsiroseomonas oryziterrae]|uniref:CBS domain-containing protein n=1 Tax=Falsiroseomonas oryziterrae TaxID=2911368 RepID=UPI001F1B5131|nr:CBS domain-containing protein [Roseomonas sp. NPKOSM-4]